MSIAIGALFAIPLTKAGLFSRERKQGPRTDSMTFQRQVTWSSHLVRLIIFTISLPLVGLAYTASSAGKPRPHMIPIVFAGAVGLLSTLAIAECHGLIMETYDTCDLQPGANSRHRLQSMAVNVRRHRTNYSSFPLMTAGILLFLTILLTAVLWRFKKVQVIPNHAFGTRRNMAAGGDEMAGFGTDDWKPVIIGNPSGKMRRMSVLKMGGLSRWTGIRKLNKLIKGESRTGRGFSSWVEDS